MLDFLLFRGARGGKREKNLSTSKNIARVSPCFYLQNPPRRVSTFHGLSLFSFSFSLTSSLVRSLLCYKLENSTARKNSVTLQCNSGLPAFCCSWAPWFTFVAGKLAAQVSPAGWELGSWLDDLSENASNTNGRWADGNH